MSKRRISAEQQLAQANIAITNALADPSLAEPLAGYGYSARRIQQGKELYETALALYQRQKSAYGDLHAANDAYASALRQAQAMYMRYVKIARVALEDDRGASHKLGLAGAHDGPQARRRAQAQQFYASALSDTAVLDTLASCGITRAMLEDGQRQWKATGDNDAARRLRQGAARDATKMRDAALAALHGWMRDFVQIARVALRDRPQFLAKLGIDPGAAHKSRLAGAAPAPIIAMAVPLPSAETPKSDHAAAAPAASQRNGTKPVGVPE